MIDKNKLSYTIDKDSFNIKYQDEIILPIRMLNKTSQELEEQARQSIEKISTNFKDIDELKTKLDLLMHKQIENN